MRLAVGEFRSNAIRNVSESYARDSKDEREELDHVARLGVLHAC